MALLTFRLLLAGLFKCLHKTCCKPFDWVKKTYDFLINGMFFRMPLILSIEIFMEIVVVVYLNFLPKDLKALQPGEVLGYFISGLGVIICFVLLPGGVIWLVYKQPNRQQLEREEFKERWGVLYDDIRTGDRWQLAFYLMFIIRRAVFLLLGLYILQDEYAIF